MSDSWFNRDIPVCQQEKGTRIAMIYDCLQVTVCKCRELFSVLTTGKQQPLNRIYKIQEAAI